MRFSKSPIRFAASVRIDTFRHPTDHVRTAFDRRRGQTTNHVQQRDAPLISMHDHHVALRNIEAKWLKLTVEQRVFWGKQDAIRYREQHAELSQHFKDELKLLQEPQKALINDLFEQKEQDQKRIQQGIIRNCDLLVGSSLLSLSTDFSNFSTVCGFERENREDDGAGKLQPLRGPRCEKIPPTVGVQEGLDKLAQRSEFTEVLHKEVQARKLVVEDVMACLNHLYDKVCKRTKEMEDAMVVVRAARYTDNERAALVVLLKLQDNWLDPLDWIEDMST
ncbi:hypothetical protein B9Z19DRAFT_1069412 [Tuber borchii]|uniref:Uncharacterized protein n=1 Tax=Tuber borchii TaxID=42251 RepID=A0A2T6ZBM9_TUBBO|nr:hypothetical protein B9Z19DRAFT_1069412 [Tuber borchii]